MDKKVALIIVDLQNDFCSGGSLAVPEGEDIIPLANKLQKVFDIVVATQDWHPPNHVSFADTHSRQIGDEIEVAGLSQTLWPTHCVQNSHGAAFHPHFYTQKVHKIFHKGIDKDIDSYSAFFDNAHKRATGLGDYLQSKQVENVYIMGLATDYCVKFSALDAVHLGFKTYVIKDACRGVELNEGDIEKAFSEMQSAGVIFVKAKDLL